MHWRRGAAVSAAVATLAACGEVTGGRHTAHRVRGSLVFSAAGAAVRGPFVSIAESVVVTVAPPSEVASRHARRIPPNDSVVTVDVEVPTGTTAFSASVRSNVDTVLYDGSVNRFIDAGGFVVDVPLAARQPVLVLEPDELRIVIPARGIGRGTIIVHNRGADSLRWPYEALPGDVPPPCVPARNPSGPRPLPRGCLRFFTGKLMLRANDSVSVELDSLSATPGPFTLRFSAFKGTGQNAPLLGTAGVRVVVTQ